MTEKRVSCSQGSAVSEEEIDMIGFKREKKTKETITFEDVARDLTQKEWQKMALAERNQNVMLKNHSNLLTVD